MALASNCINISVKGDSVKKNYMDLIEPLKKQGDTKGRQFLETLEIFLLDAGTNTAKTSEIMDVHTNTVQYRMKRIKEILNADIMEITVMQGLAIALAIDRIERRTK
jgi:DNA-binding PucR family transcriptional regulator